MPTIPNTIQIPKLTEEDDDTSQPLPTRYTAISSPPVYPLEPEGVVNLPYKPVVKPIPKMEEELQPIGPIEFDLGPHGGSLVGWYDSMSVDEDQDLIILSHRRDLSRPGFFSFVPPVRTEGDEPILLKLPDGKIIPVYSPFSKPIRFRNEDLLLLPIATDIVEQDN